MKPRAQGDGGEEHLAPAEGAALHDDATLGDHRAESGRGGLHEVAPGLDGLDDRRGDLLRRHLGGAVGGRVGGNGQQLGTGADRLVAAPGVEDLEGDQESQAVRRGCASGPCHGRATASSGTPDRSAKCAKKERSGTYSPKGTRCTFSKTPTMWPFGPQATTSLRNEVVDAGSVTPTSSVVWSLPGQPAQERRLGRPGQRAVERHDVLGPQHEVRDGMGVGHGEASPRAARRGRKLGETCSLLRPRCPPPCTRATRNGPHRRTAVGRDQADDGQHDDPRRDDEGADEHRRPASPASPPCRCPARYRRTRTRGRCPPWPRRRRRPRRRP